MMTEYEVISTVIMTLVVVLLIFILWIISNDRRIK